MSSKNIFLYKSLLLNFLLGALKPKDHCCYDICGAVIHIETEAASYGYADTLDVIYNSVQYYLPKDTDIKSDITNNIWVRYENNI